MNADDHLNTTIAARPATGTGRFDAASARAPIEH
jgi:hypothetical protein